MLPTNRNTYKIQKEVLSGSGIQKKKNYIVSQLMIMQDRIEIPERNYPCGIFEIMTSWFLFDIFNVEVMLPSGVLTQVCTDLEKMGDQIKIEINEKEITFDGFNLK